MIPYLTATELRAALPYPELIAALREAFRSNIVAPKRHVHSLSDPQSKTNAITADPVLLLMPVWQTGGHLGVKLVTVAPANTGRKLPTLHSVFLLFDASTGAPLALLDGEELTSRRTAAASAMASGWLSRPDSASLLMVGTGALAPYMAAAHCAARPLRRIAVWGRNPEKIEATIAAIRNQGVPEAVVLEAASDLETAAGSADIISCATTSTVPLVRGAWLRPGTHVDLAGGFKPDMREADDDLIASAEVFVDTFAGALGEAGDLLQPISAGRLKRSDILAELADLAMQRHPGRTDPEQITVFKSVGTGIEDLCAANLAWSGRA